MLNNGWQALMPNEKNTAAPHHKWDANSAHFVSLVLCFLSSAASKAAPADAPTADNIFVLSGETTQMSNSRILFHN